MTVIEDVVHHRHLRAPQENRGVLLHPPPDQIEKLVRENVAIRHADDYANYDCQGWSLGEMARSARDDLVFAAIAYTSSYADVEASHELSTHAIFLAGHQPELFHPGVWSKHFFLSRLAERHRGVAVYLLIDSDHVKRATVRVPGGSVERPIVEATAYDAVAAKVPYEEYRVRDPQLFESFGDRAAAVIGELVPQPMLENFWPMVVERLRASGNVGESFAQARHIVERRWGLKTLEIPQSIVCGFRAFHWFTAHLLAQLPRFVEIYNSSVAEFRRENRIRSAAHPVPDLQASADWLEAPFWIWDKDDPRRRALFVRQRGEQLELSDRAGRQATLFLSAEADAGRAADQLAELAERGIKIRTRALVTTIFARLLLGDGFVHGIGGAKYDQVTDRIVQQFFGFTLPRYLTCSATLRLPISREPVTAQQLRDVEHRLRAMRFHPETFLSGSENSAVKQHIDEKRRWVATQQTPRNAHARYLHISGSNEALQPYLAKEFSHWRAVREQLREGVRFEGILSSREYAFCLYPEPNLRSFLLDNAFEQI